MPHDVPAAIPKEDLLAITSYVHEFRVDPPQKFKMAVFKKLLGRHKERCLCYRCKKFNPEDRDKNCSIANLLHALSVQCEIVAPVMECKDGLFEERDEPHPWIGH